MPAKRKDTGANELPRWAVTALRKLSNRTGISDKKLLSAALGMGIYQLREELMPTANLLESAEALATINPNETVDPERPATEPEIPSETVTDPDETTTVGDDPRPVEAPVHVPERSERDDPSFDNAGQRREEPGAGESHNDFISAVFGGNGVAG